MSGVYGASPFGFEDLKVYQVARQFRNNVYDVVRRLPDVEKYALAVQMRKAAVSVTNNIAEGYGRFRFQESTHFFHISRGSVLELVDDFNVCLDQGYIVAENNQNLRDQALSVIQLINGYVNYLQNSKRNDQGG